MSHGGGRSLAEPAFPNDDGRTDPSLVDVLDDDVAFLGRLGAARIFTPVVAVLLDDPGVAAVEGDKNSEMAAVLLTGADGRRALLAFTSTATMAAWNPQARPVPVLGRDAAASAISEGASALVVDLGSASFHVVETEDLAHVAAGHLLVRAGSSHGWVETAG